MSEKQVTKYKRVIRRQMKRDKDLFLAEFVIAMKGSKFRKRLKYAWQIIKG